MLKSCFLSVLRIFSPGLQNKASILMYHSIGENKAFFTVQPDTFEWQMQYIRSHNFTVVKMSELVGKLHKGEDISRHVVVTFDDGYADNWQNAFPVLKKYSIPATIFIPKELVGNSPGHSLTTSDGFTLPLMNQTQMHDLAASPLIEYMSHGMSHTEFPQLLKTGGVEALEKELHDSLAIAEVRTSLPVVAYPRGKYNDTVIASVQKYFAAAVTVVGGLVAQGDDLYRLHRNAIDSRTSRSQFKAKLSGAIEFYQKFK